MQSSLKEYENLFNIFFKIKSLIKYVYFPFWNGFDSGLFSMTNSSLNAINLYLISYNKSTIQSLEQIFTYLFDLRANKIYN